MAIETLKVEITADNSQAVASLKAVTNNLKNFETAIKKSTNPQEIQYLQRNIDILKEKIGALSGATGGSLVKGTNQAANALSNLGRVAQDAPFGFIGIQNNLNPLLESFQRLKVETGSTGGALKALGSSLMGAGGIGFALSAASALFLVFGDSMMTASKETQLATKSQQDFADSMAKSAGTAKEESVQLNSLVAIVNDTTQSTETRKRALDELKSSYEGNIELQKIDINDGARLVGIIDDISSALLRKARAAAFANLIAEEEAKIARAQQTSMEDAKEKATGLGKALKFVGDAAGMLGNETLKQGAALRAAESGFSNITKEVTSAKANIASYTKMLNANTLEQIKNNDAKKISNKEGAKTDYGAATREYQYKEPKSNFKQIRTQSIFTMPTNAPDQFGGDNSELQAAFDMSRAIERQKNELSAYNEQLARATELANFGASAFDSLFGALINGESVGAALANSFKQIAVEITKAIVKALILNAIMKALKIGGAIASGGASLAVEAGIGLVGGKKGYASGGIASGPQSGYMAKLHGTEAIFPMDKLAAYTNRAISSGMDMANMGGKQQVEVIGRVMGNDIWLSQQRTNYQRGLTT